MPTLVKSVDTIKVPNGSVGLVAWDPHDPDLFFRALGGCIVLVTGSTFTHTVWYVNGWYFDDTVWRSPDGKFHSGIRMTPGVPPVQCSLWMAPDKPLTVVEARDLSKFSAWLSEKPDSHYGYFHLGLMAITYPTRGLWDRIGWTPFDGVVHNVCSTAPVEAYRYMGRDPFPGQDKNDLAPVSWTQAEGLHKESPITAA